MQSRQNTAASKRSNRSPRQRSVPTRLPVDSLAFSILEASRLVVAVLEGRNLTEAFEAARLAADPPWTDASRAAIRDLSWRCLRDYGWGDGVLAGFLHKPLPDTVRAVLLVAIARLDARPEHAHTTVDQAVEALTVVAPGLKGVANGVLRNVLRQSDTLCQRLGADAVSRYRHPAWWIARIRAAFPDNWESVLLQSNTPPPMSLRVNIRRTGIDEVITRLAEQGVVGTRLEHDAVLLDRPVAVSAIEPFSHGLVSVQDAGAQWAARLLAPHTGERVLDACAAPGGKSAHLLERADIDLQSLELDPRRAEQIRHTFDRLGLDGRVVIGDASKPHSWWDGRPFDCILADVPCSASGVARRHPDIKWLRRVDDIARFATQQRAIIDALWSTLAPGGRMLYVTCSLFEQENRQQVDAFLTRHPDATRIAIMGAPDRQLIPTAEHDGFYYALLRKTA